MTKENGSRCLNSNERRGRGRPQGEDPAIALTKDPGEPPRFIDEQSLEAFLHEAAPQVAVKAQIKKLKYKETKKQEKRQLRAERKAKRNADKADKELKKKAREARLFYSRTHRRNSTARAPREQVYPPNCYQGPVQNQLNHQVNQHHYQDDYHYQDQRNVYQLHDQQVLQHNHYVDHYQENYCEPNDEILLYEREAQAEVQPKAASSDNWKNLPYFDKQGPLTPDMVYCSL